MGRQARVATAVLFALALGFGLTVMAADTAGTLTGRLGGDLPEFVGAGRLVADGDASRLYDVDAQRASQADLWPDGESGAILFAYPPVVAAPFAALDAAGLSFTQVYVVVTLGMVALTALTLMIARRNLAALDSVHPAVLGALAATFLPLFVGVTGGQTLAVTGLLALLVWLGLRDRVDVLAGVAAGLLLYKPQYGLVAFVLLVLARRWRSLGVAAATGLALGVASTLVAGGAWMSSWFELLRDFSATDAGANAHNEVSWLGQAQALLGHDTRVATVLGVSLAVGTVLVFLGALQGRADREHATRPLALSLRSRRLRRRVAGARGRPVVDELTFAAALATTLLAVPHALYYDAGVLMLAVACIWPTLAAPRRVGLLAVVWGLGAAHVLSSTIGYEPTALAVVLVWVVAIRAVIAPRTNRPATKSGDPLEGRHSPHLARDPG